MEDLIQFFAILAVMVIQWVIRQAAKKREAAASGAPPPPIAGKPAVAPTANAAALVGRVAEQLDSLIESGRALRARGERLRVSIAGDGPFSALRAATAVPTLADVDAVLDDLAELRGMLADASPEQALLQVQMQYDPRAAWRAWQWAELRLSVLEHAASARRDPLRAETLADADAVAAALLAPLNAFAASEGLALPAQRPICVPTGNGGEAVLQGLLPNTPVVFVPHGFGDDLLRWPAVAHEISHVIWRNLPGFAEDVVALTPTDKPPLLPRPMGRRMQFDVTAMWRGWIEELTADAFAALTLGPAALRGLMHIFARPDDAEAVTRAAAVDQERLAEHPPAHLRVHLVGRLLARQGFTADVHRLLREWDDAHDRPDALLLPLAFGGTVRMPAEATLDAGFALIERLLTEPMPSLGGLTLLDVPGLDVGPGLWARARQRAAQLIAGESFHDDPRVILAAAVEAAAQAGTSPRLARAVRRAIVGEGQRAAPDPHYARRAVHLGAPVEARDALRAIVMRAVLTRPHARGPARRRRAG